MIRNKSDLRKKIKEVNALKKNVFSNPFGFNKYQLEKMNNAFERNRKIINSVEPLPADEPVQPIVSAQPKQQD